MKINMLFTLLLIRFYQVENIKSITYLTASRMPWVEWTYHYQIVKLDIMCQAGSNLENLGSFQYWPKCFVFVFFVFFVFEKKGTKNLTTPYSIPFLSVLHQNQVLHNFHKRGRRPIFGRIKVQIKAWRGIPTWLVLRLQQQRA